MLEAFWGKDNARRPNIDYKEDALFGYQESIRNKYKPDRYLKMPEVEFKRKKIDSLGMNYDYKYSNELEVENKQIQSYINELDGQMPDMEKQSLNYSHTHVPETSFYNDLLDLQNKIKERNREAGLPENLVDEEQYEKAVKSLEDEYGMNRPEQKDWFSELKQGISQRPVFEKDGDEFRKLKYQPQYGDFKKSFLEKSTTSIEDIDEPELGDFEPVTPEEQQKLDAERKELMEKLKIPKTW